jgi:uncharacterized protein (TIGR03435 family)
MTGLKGNFQVALDMSLADLMKMAQASGMTLPGAGGGAAAGAPANAPADAASDPSGGQAVYSSIEQLGLKLDERKAPVERLVIDSAEKTPVAD